MSDRLFSFSLIAFLLTYTNELGAEVHSGDAFLVGGHTVHVTATDSHGNTNLCAFTVTVNDVQAPSLTCPANIVTTTRLCAARAGLPQAEHAALSAATGCPHPEQAARAWSAISSVGLRSPL